MAQNGWCRHQVYTMMCAIASTAAGACESSIDTYITTECQKLVPLPMLITSLNGKPETKWASTLYCTSSLWPRTRTAHPQPASIG
jgi:hypothetical protein